MIGIYLTPEKSQVVKARFKKDQIEIISHASISAYLDDIQRLNVNQVIELFLEIKDIMSTKYEEIYMVLPDFLFSKIDCVNFESQERLFEEIENDIKISRENLCVSYPIDVKTATTHKKTICVLNQEFINVITEAAKEADVTLVSIEAASMAYLRSVGGWKTEKFILFVSDKMSSITSYSPIAGMYSYQLTQDISPFQLKINNNISVSDTINEILIKSDKINQATFGMANPDIIDIHVLGEEIDTYKELSIIKNRVIESVDFPTEYIKGDSQCFDDQWLIVLGTLIQNIPHVYNGSVDFMHFSSANVLPVDMLRKNKFERLKLVMKKYSKIAIIASFIILTLEVIGIFYYSMIEIPDSLQKNYKQAENELKLIDEELKIIQQCHNEDQQPMDVLNIIVSKKPTDLGFSNIEIGDKSASKDLKKTGNTKKWVQLTAKTYDAIIFQDYISSLSDENLFNGISIQQISSDTSNEIKTAKIIIGKGKVN